MASQTSNHRRHELMPLGPSRKRKDRDVFDAHRGAVATKSEPAPPPAPAQRQQQPHQPAPPSSSGGGGGGSNRLLAGYLAHEFITKGTLFGHRWEPAAAATKPPAPPHQPALLPKPQQQKPKQPEPPEPKQGKPPPAYAEVAYLLKTDAAHIPGVVNPTQLARLLRM